MTLAESRPTIESDLSCVACGYNLRMQPRDGVCPECGTSIDRTLRFPHLARSAPRWLTSLVDSVTVLLVAFAFAVACSWTSGRRDDPMSLLLGTTAWALAWFAVWLLTRPEPGVSRGRGRAWALRLCATAPYVTAFAGRHLGELHPFWGTVLCGVFMLGVLPATFLYYDHLRSAARRLPSARLAVQAGALQVSLPRAMAVSMTGNVVHDRWPPGVGQFLTMLPMPGLAGVHDFWMLLQIVRADADLIHPLPLTIAPAVLLTAFAVAVLVQFRVAFAAAARASRGGRGPSVLAAAPAGRAPGGKAPPDAGRTDQPPGREGDATAS